MSPDPKAAILAMAEDGPLVPLDGVEGAFIRRLSIAEVDRLAEIPADSGLHMLVMAIVDATGAPLFSEKEVRHLRQLKADAFRKLAGQVTQVNRMDGSGGEDVAKN